MFHVNFNIRFQFSLFPLDPSQNPKIIIYSSLLLATSLISWPSTYSIVYLLVHLNMALWMIIQTVLSPSSFSPYTGQIWMILHKSLQIHR